MTVFGVAGAFNSVFVIMELRIPPENLGSASVLCYVIGAIACSMGPSVAGTVDPTRTMLYSSIVTVGLVWSFFLPTPGKYLPKAMKLNENVTLL